MTIEPKFTTYIVSTVSGSWIALITSAIVVAVFKSEIVAALMPVLFFSLFIATGVSLVSSIIGYPSFRYLYKKLSLSAIPKLLLAGGISCLISVLGFALVFSYFISGGIYLGAIIQISLGILMFCILVVPFSVLVYWFIER
ncbi:hypothetical protein JF50_11565 [Pseudoalteromonas luteoviolacea]|uniref:Uncharacterized protein n=1 Tax=Pseudoalteromonas luteoviolacea TaxID=43657 RepID=A0A0C1MPQ4_9GAMM|nr:hypothetical protein [Pseudoalteromonas luteoviolacea]KID56568.1 hypothetical protein JF50_11565 [Pseudoalteromonas luteoviolacea]